MDHIETQTTRKKKQWCEGIALPVTPDLVTMKTNANQPPSSKSAIENEANYHKEILPNVRILTDQVKDVKLGSSGAIKEIIRIPTFTQVHNCSC